MIIASGMATRLLYVGQAAGARQRSRTISDEVSNNIAKQLLKVDGGGISNRRGEIPGFLPERGFWIELSIDVSSTF